MMDMPRALTRLAVLFSAAFLVSATFAGAAAPQAAEPLAAPTGDVMLSVSGKITETNNADRADFDRALLQSLEWRTVSTITRWTEGILTFEGVPLNALLKKVGASGTKITATALNDYKIEIPASDAEEFDVLLALKSGGDWMAVRDKGPIWIVYPHDDDSAEDIPDLHAYRMVWQLRTLRVE